MGLFRNLRNGLFAKSYRRRYPIYVDAPPYDARSGGSRAINLLASHLTRLGYEAYIITRPPDGTLILPGVRFLNAAIRANHTQAGRIPIAVYPEVVCGNPIETPFVVRFLLNKPGYIVPDVELSYGAEDLYVCFDLGYAPAGRPAFDLYVPLVDKSVYFPPAAGEPRKGFVVFSHHEKSELSALPGWVDPIVEVSMDAPRSHEELAEIYRSASAMVTRERSAAIFEALCCGCPVIGLPNASFAEATYQRRFGGAGLVWGFDQDQLAQASVDIKQFESVYEELEANLDDRVRTAFDTSIKYFHMQETRRLPSSSKVDTK